MAAFLKVLSSILSAIIIFVSSNFGVWTEQVKSVSSIKKVADGFYTMDYTYDYDIDEMLERGVPTTVGLIGYGLANTLTDIKGFGCTTFNAVNEDNEYIFARNYDYMDSPYLLVWTHPKDGYASMSSVSLYFLLYQGQFMPEDEASGILTLLAPYIPVDGINEKGLSIGVLELEKDPVFQLTCKPDLTTTTMIRAVLDKAATVDEAIEIFESHDMHDLIFDECTYHYQIADASGKSAVIEYVDGKMNILYPEKKADNKTDYIIAANYFLTPGVDDPDGLGYERVATAKKALDASKGLVSEYDAMKILKSVSVKDEDMNGYICSTLWSAVYNTHDLTLNVCVHNNYDNQYMFSLDKPQQRLR